MNYLTLLKSKLHGVICTETDLDYEGSILIDEDLMDKVGIRIYEQVDVYNKTNGNRHTTYALPLPRGSNKISVNGAGAHLTNVGDELIICAYIRKDYTYAVGHEPKIYIAEKT
jgi:aspartate 1-decarboxylase